jgi:hypothetical protein
MRSIRENLLALLHHPTTEQSHASSRFALQKAHPKMSGTIVGNVKDLSIACKSGQKHLYGHALAEGSVLDKLFAHSDFDPQVTSFVNIYAEKNEELYGRLMISEESQSLTKLYPKLQTLFAMRKYGSRLSFDLMLQASDFNFFSRFVEAHFFKDLVYRFNIPFLEFPIDAQAQANVDLRGSILPTRSELQSGKPCFLPNVSMAFVFSQSPAHP